ncbi:MAG: hypothetical protein AB1Z98_07650 [Nannocystaceae bacterium]
MMSIKSGSKGQRRIGLVGLIAGLALPLSVGCATDESGDGFDDFDNDRIVEITSETTCVGLVAGKKIDAGTVCTSIDNTVDTSAQCGAGSTGVMNVTLETTGPWELEFARIGVGAGLEDIPTNRRGRVRRNILPYQSGQISGATSHTFAVPLCDLGLDGSDEVCDPVKAHMVAHARVRKQKKNGSYRYKGAWADGVALGSRRRFGKYYTMELGCTADEPPPPPVAECETAFAAGPGATCFLGADFDGDGLDDGHANWGFSNGPVSPGTSTQWPVYAAVGGCDPSQGTHVGNLGISYDGASATLVFDRVGEATLDEEQLYVGSEALPRDADGELSTTPSDFPVVLDLDSATQSSHTITGLSGDINVVYHAITCGAGQTPNPDPLSVLTDEFLVDGDLSGWALHRPEDATVSVDDGALVIVPNPSTWWYATDEALQVYKTVSGDFAVTAQIQVTNLNGGPAAPGAPYRIGGIMMRDTSSTLPNTYHMGIGNMNLPEVVTVSKSTDEGTSAIDTQPWSGTDAEMRLCRVGSEVLAFVRLEDEPWTKIDHRVRADLPNTLAVGAIGYAGTAIPDLRVEADYVEYETIHDLADCYRD